MKNKKLIFGVLLGALAITGGILAWRKWGKPKSKGKDEEQEIKDQLEEKEKAQSQGQTYTPPKANETFPLSVGMRGKDTTALQGALIKRFNIKLTTANVPTGYFGSKTEGAVKEIGYAVPLTQPDFNRILEGKYPSATPATTTTSSGGLQIKKGKLLFSKNKNTPIWNYGKTDSFSRYSKKDEQLGTISDVFISQAGTKDEKKYIVFGKDEFDKKHFIRAELAYVVG